MPGAMLRHFEVATDGRVSVDIPPGGSALGNVTQQYNQVLDGISGVAFGRHGSPGGGSTAPR